jgi:hypothetical protein
VRSSSRLLSTLPPRIILLVFGLAAVSGCAAKTPVAVPVASRASAWLYLPGRLEAERVPYVVVDGVAVMGGDIVLGPVETLHERYGAPPASLAPDHASGAMALDSRSRLWPGGVIPFVIAPAVSPETRGEIARAIDEVNRTRLSLRPRTPFDRDYVVFEVGNRPGVCDALLGRVGGAQSIRIAGCGRATIIHEILHAAGFDHEHQRPDRDHHVTIVWDNIAPEHRVWFERREHARVVLGPYDYESIMHYGASSFSHNGGPTIVPRVAGMRVRGESLSVGDIRAIEHLYGSSGPAPLPPLPAIGALPLPDLRLPSLPSVLPSTLPVALPPGLFGGALGPTGLSLPQLPELGGWTPR